MTHEEKIQYMKDWCYRNKLVLQLEGEVGFGRECVGVTHGGSYPDYMDHDDETYETLFGEEVWKPDDAYHKHGCVSVLGRGEHAESQLYEWLKWFYENGYVIHEELRKPSKHSGGMDLLIHGMYKIQIRKKEDIANAKV